MNKFETTPDAYNSCQGGKFSCYLINLDRSHDRLLQMGERLKGLGIAFDRLRAVDGRELAAEEYQRLISKNRYYRTLSHGEVGCYLSHIAAMERLLASSASYALVLEDDMVLPDNLQAIISQAILLREKAPPASAASWHVLKLQGHRKFFMPIEEILPGHELVEYGLSVPHSTGAALWHREGAKRFLDHYCGVTRPIDCELQHPWEYDLQICSVHPAVATTEGASIIGARKKERTQALRKISYEARRVVPKLWHFAKMYGFSALLFSMLRSKFRR